MPISQNYSINCCISKQNLIKVDFRNRYNDTKVHQTYRKYMSENSQEKFDLEEGVTGKSVSHIIHQTIKSL